jgi:hypothetical protein
MFEFVTVSWQVKLVLGIEDPRAKERRDTLGVEDESGVSREDLQICLQEVKDGAMPPDVSYDRVALRRLAEEMREYFHPLDFWKTD